MSVTAAEPTASSAREDAPGVPQASLPERVRVPLVGGIPSVTRGEEWRDRRAFNEHVLATSERVHPFGGRFVAVVGDEVGRLELDGQLEWADFERLFDHITLRVIFGDGARDDQELTGLLEKLMGEANRLVGLKRSDDYYELYARLERGLSQPEPGSLIERFADAPQTDATRLVPQ